MLLLILSIVLLLFAKGPILIVAFFIATVFIAILINISKIRIIGIEFATFLGVITAIAYNPVTGVGAVLIAIHMIIANYFGPYTVWAIPAYGIGSYVAGLFGSSVIMAGLYATILINVICLAFTMIFYRQHARVYTPYLISNILINFFMISAFGLGVIAAL